MTEQDLDREVHVRLDRAGLSFISHGASHISPRPWPTAGKPSISGSSTGIEATNSDADSHPSAIAYTSPAVIPGLIAAHVVSTAPMTDSSRPSCVSVGSSPTTRERAKSKK